MFVDYIACTIRSLETDVLHISARQISAGIFPEKDNTTIGRAIVMQIIKTKRCELLSKRPFIFGKNVTCNSFREKVALYEIGINIRERRPHTWHGIECTDAGKPAFSQYLFFGFCGDTFAWAYPYPCSPSISHRGKFGWLNLYDKQLSAFQYESLHSHNRLRENIAVRAYIRHFKHQCVIYFQP